MKSFSTTLAGTLLALAAAALPAQELQVGQLLFASPALRDPNFGETVLLLLLHDEQGSRAVALNRPTWVNPAEAFPELPVPAESGQTLFFGGPVSPDQLVIVFEAGDESPLNARRVFGDIFITTDPEMLEVAVQAADGAPRARYFAGHAAWAPGQLEAEIAAGSWRAVPATPAQVFSENPAALWNNVPSAGGGITARR